MATENVGSISASLELQTDKFEKGIARAEKSLNSFASSMQSSQRTINSSIAQLTKQLNMATNALAIQINKGSAKVTHSISDMADTVVDATNFLAGNLNKETGRIVTGLQAVSTVSARTGRDTVGAISSMEHRVTRHLQKINDQFVALHLVSSEDFTAGIKKLTRAIGKGTGAIVGNLREIQNESKKTKKSVEETGGGKGGFFSGKFGKTIAGLKGIMSTVSKLTFQAFLLEQAFEQVGDIIGAITSPAMKFASSMETLQLGYAGIIASTMTQYGEDIPYERALQISDALLVKMQDEALKTSLTIEELGSALQSSMAMGLNAGMKLDQILDLTVVAAQAVKTFGLSNQQVIQEIRGLISGDAIRAGQDTLATVLGYTTAEVNMLREEGRLYEDIMERMKGFRSSSEAFQDTLEGLISNLQDGLSRIAGIAGQGLFKAVKSFLKDLQGVFFTLEKITKTINGKEVNFFKVHLNETTLNILTHLYNTFANLLRIVHQFGKAVMVVLSPLLEILAVLLDRLTLAGSILALGFEPVIRGVKIVLDAFMRILRFSDELNESLLQNEYVLTGLVAVASVYATSLAVKFTVAFLPILKIPLIIVSIAGAVSFLLEEASNSVENFGKWLDAKMEVYKNKWEAMKEDFSWGGDDTLAKQYYEQAQKAQEEADKLWDTWTVKEVASKVITSIANKVSNVVPNLKKDIEGLFDGLDSKYKAKKDPSGGANAQSKALQELEKVLKKINSEYAKMVGNSQELFESEMIGEYWERINKLENNLDLINSKLQSCAESEKERWKQLKQVTEEGILKEKALFKMKLKNYSVTQSRAEVDRLNLEVQNEYLATKIQLQNSQISEIAGETKLYNLKKSHIKEYIKYYQQIIQMYEDMASNTGNTEIFVKYKKESLKAQEELEALKQAIHPVEKALRENLIGGISDAFQAMAWQEKSAKEALEDLATSFTKTWTKMLFDTAVNDMFKKVFGKGTLSSEVDALVNVDVTQFEDSITSSAHAVQTCLVNELIPAIQQTASALNGETTGATPLGGLSGLIASKNSSTPSAGLTVGGETLGEGVLGSFVSAIKGSANGLEGLTDSVKTNEGAVNNATNFAIPMMIASVLSASGALGKFGIVLQHVMMMMQIAQATHIMGFATGGYVSGAGTGTSDSIPARLSDGEYVMKASSVNRLGVAFLDKLNSVGGKSHSGRLPKFAYADGGYVNGSPAVGNTVVMNNTFQSLDPMGNMKMMEQMYPQIRSMYINDLQNNTSVRNATRGAVK